MTLSDGGNVKLQNCIFPHGDYIFLAVMYNIPNSVHLQINIFSLLDEGNFVRKILLP